MKKIILTVFLILAMVLGFASCAAKPELDLKDAEKNLKGEDYEVEIEDEDDLDVGIEEALEAYSEDGEDYIVIIRFENKKYAKLNYEMMKQEQDAKIDAIELEIKQIEYMLKHYDDDLDSDDIDYYEDKIKELNKELEDIQENYVCGIKGKVVWIGTPKAVEDSKK